VTEQSVAVCDAPEAVCDPPGWNGVEPIELVEVVPSSVESVPPEVESHEKETPSRKNGVCCCQ